MKRGVRSACQLLFGLPTDKIPPNQVPGKGKWGYSSLPRIHRTTYNIAHGFATNYTEDTANSPDSRKCSETSLCLQVGDESVNFRIREKIALVKDRFRDKQQKLNNTEVLERALDLLIGNNPASPATLDVPQYDDEQQYFLCTDSAIVNLLNSIQSHATLCPSAFLFRREQILMCGSVASFHLYCASGHCCSWSSSVYLPNGLFLTNARWNHACLSTGLLSTQISRLQDSLGFIELQAEVQRDMTAKFATAVCATKDLVCDQALKEEIGMSEENGGAIAILTDARHGCRRNAKDTNMLCASEIRPTRYSGKSTLRGRCNYSETWTFGHQAAV